MSAAGVRHFPGSGKHRWPTHPRTQSQQVSSNAQQGGVSGCARGGAGLQLPVLLQAQLLLKGDDVQQALKRHMHSLQRLAQRRLKPLPHQRQQLLLPPRAQHRQRRVAGSAAACCSKLLLVAHPLQADCQCGKGVEPEVLVRGALQARRAERR